MKKALLFSLSFLLWICSFSQSVIKSGDTTYYPRISDNGEVYRQDAYSVVPPNNYDPGKAYPVIVLIHGVGELSQGKLADLQNVLLGFGYGPGGSRVYAVASDDYKKAINTYQFIGVVVTYGSEFNPSDVNFVLSDVEKNWSVDKTREAIIGFSLGGGAVMRYITSSQANADRLAVAIACAPVNWGTNYTYIKNSGLPVILATNTTDPRVSPQNAKDMYAAITATGVTPAAKLLIFPQDGHGSINEMLSISNSWVPQNIYSYLNGVTNTAPKLYPISGATNPVPPVVVLPGTPTIVIDDIAAITSTGTVKVEACKSTGYDYFTWQVISVPKAANVYSNYTPKGAGYCNTTLQFTIEGAYGIKATACKGSTCVSDTLFITYQKSTTPVPVTAVTWDSDTQLLTLSDGSRVKAVGTINFVTNTATAKTEAGIIYTIKP